MYLDCYDCQLRVIGRIGGVVVVHVPFLITRYSKQCVLIGIAETAPNFRASMRRVTVIMNTSVTMMAETMPARRNFDFRTKRDSFVSVLDVQEGGETSPWQVGQVCLCSVERSSGSDARSPVSISFNRRARLTSLHSFRSVWWMGDF
ncbi:hypothetical protein DL93DRAFT_163710 [Clavulina sp. PMI_390]|nr:hypothetical protein DL93DRAFT_163710 [Clavulina sp. PMI_390]